MKYLFVAGCPRSGTTALARLLNHDNRIIVGIERFISIRDAIRPEHFEKHRFLNPSKDETHLFDTELFESFRAKWDQDNIRYIGDKVPRYYQHMDYLTETFPDCRILFLWRDLFAVASSYNVRAQHQINWNKERNYRRAVANWNESLKCLKEMVDAGHRDKVKVVRYEQFFSGDLVALQALYQFLDLKLRPKDEGVYHRMTQNWSGHASKPLILDEAMRTYIEEHKNKSLDRWALQLIS